jgi:hypothetical protein
MRKIGEGITVQKHVNQNILHARKLYAIEEQFAEFNKMLLLEALKTGEDMPLLASFKTWKTDDAAGKEGETFEEYQIMEFVKRKDHYEKLDKRRILTQVEFQFFCPVTDSNTSIFLEIDEVEEVEETKRGK